MRVLVDTNLFLDVLLERTELVNESERALNLFESNLSRRGWISWHTLSNLYYIGSRFVGPAQALAEIDVILQTFQVATVGTKEALEARRLAMKDFEDALQAVSAHAAKADFILTRNTRDFRASPVPSISPREFLDLS